MSDTNPPSKPLVMTPGEISQFLADCRTLIAHSRTFYEVRDALSKAVWLIESNMQPVETSTSRDARRYAVISRCVAPKDLYDRLVRDGKSPGEWVDLQREQSIQQKIDELCDAALQRSPEEPSLAPTPEHAKTGTYVTIVCEGCHAQADLPRVGREGEFMSLQPAIGWTLYPKQLCPKCSSGNGGGL